VGIASSTGGPPALEKVFSGLSASLPAAYFVVQHLPAGFSGSLARRLSSAGEIRVIEAVDGERVEPATAYLAPHGAHIRLAETIPGMFKVELSDSPPMHGVRPAADPLFESLADRLKGRAIGVILTGMGADGAGGMASIKAAGGETIVQDEETSVVWGMPGAAVRAGSARHVVPIGQVAVEIRRALRGGRVS
jgi:two-component system chemotaxis response regulator CheB